MPKHTAFTQGFVQCSAKQMHTCMKHQAAHIEPFHTASEALGYFVCVCVMHTCAVGTVDQSAYTLAKPTAIDCLAIAPGATSYASSLYFIQHFSPTLHNSKCRSLPLSWSSSKASRAGSPSSFVYAVPKSQTAGCPMHRKRPPTREVPSSALQLAAARGTYAPT